MNGPKSMTSSPIYVLLLFPFICIYDWKIRKMERDYTIAKALYESKYETSI